MNEERNYKTGFLFFFPFLLVYLTIKLHKLIPHAQTNQSLYCLKSTRPKTLTSFIVESDFSVYSVISCLLSFCKLSKTLFIHYH